MSETHTGEISVSSVKSDPLDSTNSDSKASRTSETNSNASKLSSTVQNGTEKLQNGNSTFSSNESVAPNSTPESAVSVPEVTVAKSVVLTDKEKQLADRSEVLKQKGNDKFQQGHYQEAIDLYTDAIDLFPTQFLYANRAFAYVRTESFGLAIEDAKKAIALDKTYVKAYYRLGSAYLLLNKYKQAMKVFKQVVTLQPKSKEAQTKFKQCKAEVKRMAFEEAIASEETSLLVFTYDLNSSAVNVPNEYEGPRIKKSGKVGKDSRDENEEMKNEDMGASRSYSFSDASSSVDGLSVRSDLYKNGINVDEFEISVEFCKELMKHLHGQKTLHKFYMAVILIKMYKLLDSLPTLLEINFNFGKNNDDREEKTGDKSKGSDVKFNVCGDTHGQYYDLTNIFELNGYPSETNNYLFNGDFVDRGSFSVEVVLTLFAWKLALPDHFHLLRGNHETRNMNRIYGFDGEVKHKYDDRILQMFSEVFKVLPLASVLNKKVIVMHGGLFGDDGVKLEDIRKVDRKKEPPETGLMADLLWSDPQPFPGRSPSKRGVGKSFGPDITKSFLDNNGLQLVIRSHEVRDEGYLVEHDGKLITVFSAPNYCDQMGNKGAVVMFRDSASMKPDFLKFEAVPHPDVKPMAYASNIGLYGM